MPLLAESHNLFGEISMKSHNFFSEICMESHNFDNMLVLPAKSRLFYLP